MVFLWIILCSSYLNSNSINMAKSRIDIMADSYFKKNKPDKPNLDQI